MGKCCSTPKHHDRDVSRYAGKSELRNSGSVTHPQHGLDSQVFLPTESDRRIKSMVEAIDEDQDLRKVSLGLYHYLCRHVVGTEDTVRTKRIWNTLTDNSASRYHVVTITSGSFGEGLEMKGSDLDFVYILPSISVSEDPCMPSDPNIQAHFKIVTDDTKPGTAKLSFVDGKHRVFSDWCEKVGNNLYLSNVCFKKHFSFLSRLAENPANDKVHGPCLSDNTEVMDRAYSLHSSSWIKQASPWVLRPNHSWPSHELKTRIIKHGTLFVPVGVKGSQEEKIEWRISFNVGEKLLIYSFTHTQLLCYALMKIVLKDLIDTDPQCKDLLCSYFIKNIMFWVSEELPLSVWREDNLIPCFMQCFERLVNCVKTSMCANYFIPERNMFANRVEGEKRHILLDKLSTLYSFKWRCILLSSQLQNFSVHHLDFESRLFDVHFEQIVKSDVISVRDINKNASIPYLIKAIQTHGSSLTGHSIMYILSEVCYQKALNVELCSEDSNKTLYSRYKTCQSYLMQGLHHNAASGWLMVASMFYRMKQYKRALDILSYASEKISLDKVYPGKKLREIHHELLTSRTIASMSLEKALSIIYVDKMYFDPNSLLIPEELEPEVKSLPHNLSPAVFGHFLACLCHYHLHDMGRFTNSLFDLIFLTEKNYFINNEIQKAAAYNCIGIAYQLIGESPKRQFQEAVNLDTRFNTAKQRLSKLEKQ